MDPGEDGGDKNTHVKIGHVQRKGPGERAAVGI